ncbi:hypothetical protein MUS1_09560 [Marinomonas ushuaiensis DSM 15871]|uniref:PD-(D/E)XK nuclease superfamily protein n=1 Tax=Marinomonas ushuaiensis DSM 15871 TaxID=1122207 RepID=X7E8Y0_9GAMM|nr:hypothetical protein [Marinomonas ushuaiensis]ETX11661.1 hypothetical protein MUS1_09560 [Marinomonas ushuaiensis DSM 15871]
MNKHLNIFTTYAKDNRSYQLENDLTRSLAICLQEDALFSHEVLKSIFSGSSLFGELFENLDSETNIQVEIQKQASQITEFDKVYAVSLSEAVMTNFWKQRDGASYDPVCDLVITIDNVLIVIEAKRDNIDCTAQLYNQIFNIFEKENKNIHECRGDITPVDLNWKKLMRIAVKVASFEKTMGNSNRFLTDFIQLVKDHNFRWLPETPIGSLKNVNSASIYRRIESALTEFCKNNESIKPLTYYDRLGTDFSKGWSNELLFQVDKDTGDLIADIYPGNTKSQGYHIFNKEPLFSSKLEIDGDSYVTKLSYHIKMMGQKYITGLWFNENDFTQNLFTKENFQKHTGRIKKDNWSKIEDLLDQYLACDWKSKCNWEDKIINSNRTVVNIAFGYYISISIPFKKLAQLDKNHNDITPLANLIEDIYRAFENDLISEDQSA